MSVDSQRPLLLRSLLFVPGDSEKKLAKCVNVPADALILDLEDSVHPERKAYARELVREFLARRAPSSQTVWVRINALGTSDCAADLASVMSSRPDGIVLPKARAAGDVIELGRWLEEFEEGVGNRVGTTRILPIATETPAAVLTLETYLHGDRRLAALTWGAEDLCVALGAATNVDERGEWLPPYELARSLCLLAAAGAGVPALDTVCTDFRDLASLKRQAKAARRDGFGGKLAVHPDQVEVINEVFQPAADEIEQARRVLAAFGATTAGVVALDGRMLDRPHQLRARRTLLVAEAIERSNNGRARGTR